jgi:hypothetical protein
MISGLAYRVAFEGRFRSVTPWWGGGPYGTVKDEEGRVWYPSAETVAGRTKWFTRHLLWICREGEFDHKERRDGKFNHKELEERIEELLGYIPGARPPPSALALSVDPAPDVKPAPLEPAGGSQGAKPKEVPRVALGHLGTKWHYLKDDDVPVNGVAITMRIRAPAGRLADALKVGDGARRFAAAAMITLAYAGVGRAANRGFGRFYPDPKSLRADQDIIELANMITGGDAVGAIKRGAGILLGGECADRVARNVKLVECPPGVGTLDAMRAVGEAFVSTCHDDHADFYVLGLPRRSWRPVVEDKMRGKKMYDRRQSPLIASPIVRDGHVSAVALIELYHGDFDSGELRAGKRVGNEIVEKKKGNFDDARKLVEQYIENWKCRPRPDDCRRGRQRPSGGMQHHGGRHWL